MQKIILTEKTLGTTIDRLRKLTSGFYKFYNAQDVNPSKCKSWQDSHLGDRAACADIAVHWIFKDTEHPIAVSSKKGEAGSPLIHMAIDAECGVCFGYGDIFYFKGNTLIINQVAGSHVKCMEAKNWLIKIFGGKRLKDMTLEELKFVAEGKSMAEESAQMLQEMADEDAAR